MPAPIPLNKRVEAFGYPPVGRCIYCGTTERPLTKEHIIGRGIGGTVTLAEASCSSRAGVRGVKRCSEITRDIEDFCFRKMLGHFRHQMKFPVRKRLAKLPLHIAHSDGRIDVEYVDIKDHLGMMTVPVFAPPGILTGRLTDPPNEIWSYIPNPEIVKRYPERTGIGRNEFNQLIYARMLAKIAHAWAAADIGLDNFELLFLPNFILGKDLSVPADYFVGCLQRDMPPEEMNHRVSMDTMKLADGRKFLSANIRLFAKFGAPQYHVVIGVLKASASETNLTSSRTHSTQDLK